MSKIFIEIDRQKSIEMPSDLEGWVKSDSLARFVVDIIDKIDTSNIEDLYKVGGSDAYPPTMLLSLLLYCYAKGIFSSRKIEAATYELMPVIYIANGLHPDHTSISNFRKNFLKEIEELFIQFLKIAAEMGILKIGDISIDGTKIQANASKHKALSYGHAIKLEEKIKEEIKLLLKKAEEPDNSAMNDIKIPEEISRREDRLSKIKEVQEKIKERYKIKYKLKKAEYDEKVKKKKEKEKKLGRKLGGKKPTEPPETPPNKEQVNLTDEESRIMPKSGGGFIQAYNAQASTDMDTMLIVGNHISQNTNDKKELQPALEKINKLPSKIAKEVDRIAVDNGYKSEENANLLDKNSIKGYMPIGREKEHNKIEDLLAKEPDSPANPTPIEEVNYRMSTKEGKEFYAKRKSTIEPIFGSIKSVMGFVRFSLRGLEAVTGEWNIVSLAYNFKRLHSISMSTI